MLELCIDTSAGASVAVLRAGKVLARAHSDHPRRHAENLGALIAAAATEAELPVPLKDAGWSRVCVGTGPAPFTGLRAGLITAEVFARAAGVPIYGVPSLALMARGALDLLPAGLEVIAVSDARRKEVYWARYRASGPDSLEVIVEPRVSAPETIAGELRREDALLVGPGAPLVQERLGARAGSIEPADAAVLSRLVTSALKTGIALPTSPLYLRRPDINQSSKAQGNSD